MEEARGTEKERYSHRIEQMIERCEQVFDPKLLEPAKLGMGHGQYGLNELEEMKRNAELFRRGGKMGYYWAITFAHHRITGEDLPEPVQA